MLIPDHPELRLSAAAPVLPAARQLLTPPATFTLVPDLPVPGHNALISSKVFFARLTAASFSLHDWQSFTPQPASRCETPSSAWSAGTTPLSRRISAISLGTSN